MASAAVSRKRFRECGPLCFARFKVYPQMKFGLVVRINVRIIVQFVIMLIWIPVALGQTSTPPDSPAASPNPVLSARSNLVLVPALVRTKSGELVFTLAAKDFTIKDDGVEEKVTLEENTDDEPLALVDRKSVV